MPEQSHQTILSPRGALEISIASFVAKSESLKPETSKNRTSLKSLGTLYSLFWNLEESCNVRLNNENVCRLNLVEYTFPIK